MELQIWHDQPAVRLLGIEVSSIGFWLSSDTTQPLPDSFSLLINARVFGAQVGSVTINPMKNGQFSMPLLAGTAGTVQGRIDDWTAYDRVGKPVQNDPHWGTAVSVGFMITGLADVAMPEAAILAAVPVLGWLAKAALAALGRQVKISVAHEQVTAHLPHGEGGA